MQSLTVEYERQKDAEKDMERLYNRHEFSGEVLLQPAGNKRWTLAVISEQRLQQSIITGLKGRVINGFDNADAAAEPEPGGEPEVADSTDTPELTDDPETVEEPAPMSAPAFRNGKHTPVATPRDAATSVPESAAAPAPESAARKPSIPPPRKGPATQLTFY